MVWLDTLVGEIAAPKLTGSGFRRSRRSFTRVADNGFSVWVNFQRFAGDDGFMVNWAVSNAASRAFFLGPDASPTSSNGPVTYGRVDKPASITLPGVSEYEKDLWVFRPTEREDRCRQFGEFWAAEAVPLLTRLVDPEYVAALPETAPALLGWPVPTRLYEPNLHRAFALVDHAEPDEVRAHLEAAAPLATSGDPLRLVPFLTERLDARVAG